jgi:drug/metabolite transporter (DMT)-like permease
LFFIIITVIGFFIVLLSSVFFCFQNVIVRVLFAEHSIFGLFVTGGFVTPTLQNSFLLMFMRMLLVVPLMASIASQLYSATWNDLAQLRISTKQRWFWQSIGCGGLMFLYLALLYVSIGLIPTGIAMTLFFTYPGFTALFSWRLFGDRPTLRRWSVMGLVFLGSFLAIPSMSASSDRYNLMGFISGIASGITYALYTVFAQKSFEHLHPVPFTWLSFTTTLILSGASLLVWHLPDLQLPWTALWIGGLLSAIVTFAGHLLNNFGIRLIGATTAAMIGATNPVLTVVLAWFSIQETLNGRQLIGVAIVTLSVALLSQERRSIQRESQ